MEHSTGADRPCQVWHHPFGVSVEKVHYIPSHHPKHAEGEPRGSNLTYDASPSSAASWEIMPWSMAHALERLLSPVTCRRRHGDQVIYHFKVGIHRASREFQVWRLRCRVIVSLIRPRSVVSSRLVRNRTLTQTLASADTVVGHGSGLSGKGCATVKTTYPSPTSTGNPGKCWILICWSFYVVFRFPRTEPTPSLAVPS